LTREIVGRELSVRWRATEAIVVGQTPVRDQGIARGQLTLGTDNGSALTARRLGLRSPGSASLTVAATAATVRTKRSSGHGCAIWSNAASGATSARPSTRPGEVIAADIDHYHDRLYGPLDYQDPTRYATWDDAQGAPQNIAA
jgi:hypothetical protein